MSNFYSRRRLSEYDAKLFLIDGLDKAFKEDLDKFLESVQDLQGQANEGSPQLRMQLVLVGRLEIDLGEASGSY